MIMIHALTNKLAQALVVAAVLMISTASVDAAAKAAPKKEAAAKAANKAQKKVKVALNPYAGFSSELVATATLAEARKAGADSLVCTMNEFKAITLHSKSANPEAIVSVRSPKTFGTARVICHSHQAVEAMQCTTYYAQESLYDACCSRPAACAQKVNAELAR